MNARLAMPARKVKELKISDIMVPHPEAITLAYIFLAKQNDIPEPSSSDFRLPLCVFCYTHSPVAMG